ncbi:MAG: choice-of-anchor J domain-containing protein [Candidatus Margulisiibacteriota bacterium]|jgi:hypothetical protein
MKKLICLALFLVPVAIVGCGTTTSNTAAPAIQSVVASPQAVAPGGYVRVNLSASDEQGNILSYKIGSGASHLYANGASAIVQAQASSGLQDIDIFVGNGRLDARAKTTIQVNSSLPASTLRSGRVTLPLNKSFDFFSGTVKDQYYGDVDYLERYYYGASLAFNGNHNGGTTASFDGGLVNLTYFDSQITELSQVCEKYTGDYYSGSVPAEGQRYDESTLRKGDIYCFILINSGNSCFGKLRIEELNNSEIVFDYVVQTAPNEPRFYDVDPAASTPVPTREVLSSFTDDAESGVGKWLSNGFAVTTVRAASGTHSFYSGRGDDLNNSLTMVSPVLITVGEKLIFQTYYKTESSYDYLYVQASIDGATWTTLASYDGTNLSWSRKELLLNDYAGQTIYIRFKYATDSSVDYEGVYIDDISIE